MSHLYAVLALANHDLSVRASFSVLEITTGISSSSVGTIQFVRTIRKTVRKSYSKSRAWLENDSFTIVLSQTIILDTLTLFTFTVGIRYVTSKTLTFIHLF